MEIHVYKNNTDQTIKITFSQKDEREIIYLTAFWLTTRQAVELLHDLLSIQDVCSQTPTQSTTHKESTMGTYVYIEVKDSPWAEKFAVGFFNPQTTRWVNESNYTTAQAAAQRVHWLNGGNEPTHLEDKE